MTGALQRLRGGLVVSCQAYPGEPMRDPRTMTQLAQAAVAGGAAGLRLQGLADLGAVAGALDVPVIGIWKDGASGVVITPTLRHALAVAATGVPIVALDGTRRPRPDGLSLAATVAELRRRHDVLLMADCGSLDDARSAEDAGVDVIGTTLAGYTGERPLTDGPDLDLIDQAVTATALPVIAEGRVHTPPQAAEALQRGAFAVCVGTAITHPTSITRWFHAALRTTTGNPHSAARLTSADPAAPPAAPWAAGP